MKFPEIEGKIKASDRQILYNFMMDNLDCKIFIPRVCITSGCYAYKVLVFTDKKGFKIDGANPHFYTIANWKSNVKNNVWGPIIEVDFEYLLFNWNLYGHWSDKKIQPWMTAFHKGGRA